MSLRALSLEQTQLGKRIGGWGGLDLIRIYAKRSRPIVQPTTEFLHRNSVLRRLCNDWRQLLPKFVADHTPFPRRRLWRGTEQVQVLPFRTARPSTSWARES